MSRGRPAKKERNEQLFDLREKDPKRYSFEVLGEIFNVQKATAWEIYHRERQNRHRTAR